MARQGGAKLATKIAMTTSKALVATHASLSGIKHKLAMAIFHSISDTISEEVHRTIGNVLTSAYEQLPEDSMAKPLFKFMSEETGQLQALIGYAVGASGITTSISSIMNNELAPIVYSAIGDNPHLIPDAGTIAGFAARDIISIDAAVAGIAENGISGGWANWLIEANQVYPGIGEILDLMRRGIVDADTAVGWSMRNGIPESVVNMYLGLLDVPLSPADAALALLRGNMSADDAQAAAAASGVNPVNFNIMVENVGEPLGLMQLLEAYRRQFIDQGTLEQGILQSRVRDEWIPTALQLAYSPMTVSDAVNAVVQNQLDEATAEDYATQNGLMPGQFAILLETAGEPLSRTEMEQLYNRGLVTEEQVTQALSESRLKNKYNDLAFELHTRLPDPSTLSDAIVYGAIDENTAVGKAMELGYSESDATMVVQSASNAKMFQYRTKVVEAVSEQYQINAIDNTTATGYITAMGFSSEQAAIILQSAEYDRIKRMQESAINAVRSKFITHHIDQTDMQTALQSIGVPAGEITQLTEMWTIEQGIDVKLMSPMDVAKAVAASLMTSDEGTQYLVNQGYSQSDAAILVQVAS
jgi:hypothetical protein